MIIKRPLGEKGQVVIPKYIREMLNLRAGEKVVFEINDSGINLEKEETSGEFLEDFFNIARKGKDVTLNEIKKIEDESYDLP